MPEQNKSSALLPSEKTPQSGCLLFPLESKWSLGCLKERISMQAVCSQEMQSSPTPCTYPSPCWEQSS